MKIAILTGGGDVPGLNVVLKEITLRAEAQRSFVLGIRRGWAGLVELDTRSPESIAEHTCRLERRNVRTIDRSGGTVLHSSRTLPARMARHKVPAHVPSTRLRRVASQAGDDGEVVDLTAQVLHNLHQLAIDVLVVVGGDDTLSYAERLHREGVAVLGIPKTMDNDVAGTEYCLGFATCVARTVGYVHQLRSCTASHERLAVIEVMGRNSGASALVPAYLADVDRCVVAEVPCDAERLAEKLLSDRAANPQRYALVIVSEGARLRGGDLQARGTPDAYGHRKLGGIGAMLGDTLQRLTGVGTVQQALGYLVRSGPPDAVDCMVARQFAAVAWACLEKKIFGQLIVLQRGVYAHVPMDVLGGAQRSLDVSRYYDAQEFRPKVACNLGLPLYFGG